MQMEQFWNADVEGIQREASIRIFEEGKGKLGTIDKNLLNDIEELRKQREK